VPTIVPSLGDLLNQQPTMRIPLTDAKITTRCPKSDCFSLQLLSEATITRGRTEARYDCSVCGTTMVLIRSGEAAAPDLPRQEVVGEWTYWTGLAGVHVRLANVRRIQNRPSKDERTV
jgi:hypothetical protein